MPFAVLPLTQLMRHDSRNICHDICHKNIKERAQLQDTQQRQDETCTPLPHQGQQAHARAVQQLPEPHQQQSKVQHQHLQHCVQGEASAPPLHCAQQRQAHGQQPHPQASSALQLPNDPQVHLCAPFLAVAAADAALTAAPALTAAAASCLVSTGVEVMAARTAVAAAPAAQSSAATASGDAAAVQLVSLLRSARGEHPGKCVLPSRCFQILFEGVQRLLAQIGSRPTALEGSGGSSGGSGSDGGSSGSSAPARAIAAHLLHPHMHAHISLRAACAGCLRRQSAKACMHRTALRSNCVIQGLNRKGASVKDVWLLPAGTT